MNTLKNTIKYSVSSGLSLLAILAVGTMIMPGLASAQYPGYVTAYNTTQYNGGGVDGAYPGSAYYQPTTYYQPAYQAPMIVNTTPVVQPTPTIYSNSTNPNKVATVTKKVAKAPAKKTDTSLTATAVNANGFMPSGLIQWILLAILILIIVILVRKASGADRKYHAIPMKHA